jgi:hypothetical protein
VTVAGGNGSGDGTNQLNGPQGLFVDEEDTVIVTDSKNNRIMAWKRGDTNGTVLAGENGSGNRSDQLNDPTDLTLDRETECLIICDRGNRRVTRCSCRTFPVETAGSTKNRRSPPVDRPLHRR